MALITGIEARKHAGTQPFRDWNCRYYKDCLDQAARINCFLTCDDCSRFEPSKYLDLYDIQMEARLLFAVFHPKAWMNGRQGRRR